MQSMTARLFAYLVLGNAIAFALAFVVVLWRVHHPIAIATFGIAILAVAFAVAQFATRPVRDLARAATRLEVDIGSDPLPVAGPTEVRQAATAFNAMQARIAHDVRERTFVLAAITHDLQTPVTRLRLRLEKVADDALRAKLIEDLSAMSETIREGLELATSLDASEPLQPIDLDSTLESAVADAADAGHDVTLVGRTGASVEGVPNALRRCITNLLDNAVAYGRFARVYASNERGRAIVHIRDGGPGIPEHQLCAVLEPFVRVETSRSRETGGTGIGLTVAHNTVRRMRGTLALRNHPDGGLEVTLEFPVADAKGA